MMQDVTLEQAKAQVRQLPQQIRHYAMTCGHATICVAAPYGLALANIIENEERNDAASRDLRERLTDANVELKAYRNEQSRKISTGVVVLIALIASLITLFLVWAAAWTT